jgi:N-acetylmuramoyl-L-alanine amidase
VLGHADVAPLRKEDPGELFDWPRLARAGLAIWPKPPVSPRPWAIDEAQAALARFGYGVPRSGRLDGETRAVAVAFQRHFRPARLDGELDPECCGILAALNAEVG